MWTPPFFRRKLAHRLRNGVARRRVACAGDPSGEDIKVIALLDRLAREAEQLPQALIDEVAQLCTEPAFARCLGRVWDTLPDVIGVLVVPKNAADLVGWMVEQARGDPDPDVAQAAAGPATTPTDPPRSTERQRHSAPTSNGFVASVAVDFTGALAVVGPMLAIWETAAAIGQWQDRSFAASHAATSATVVAVETGSSRSIVPPVKETITFTPMGEYVPCRVPMQLGNRQPDALGSALVVVPRSASCEAPLIPASIGDPLTTLLVAVAFLGSGIISMKAWTRLRHLRASPGTRPLSSPARMRVAL